MTYFLVAIISGTISALLTRAWLWGDVYRYVRQVHHDYEVDLVRSLNGYSQIDELCGDSAREIH